MKNFTVSITLNIKEEDIDGEELTATDVCKFIQDCLDEESWYQAGDKYTNILLSNVKVEVKGTE